MHNGLHLTEPLPTTVSPYYGRPFVVIHGGRFCDAILARITDEDVKRLPRYVGSISQWVDSTDVLDDRNWAEPLRGAYDDAARRGAETRTAGGR
jgi:hypothetical protein